MNLGPSSQRNPELPPSRKRKAETVLVRSERSFTPSIILPRQVSGIGFADWSKNGTQRGGRVGQSTMRNEHITRDSTIGFYTLSEDRSKDTGRLLCALLPKESHRFGTRGFLADHDRNETSPDPVASRPQKIQRRRKQEQEHVMQDENTSGHTKDHTSAGPTTRSAERKPRSLPDPTKVRTWTDHSGAFTTDAQFLGIADGKLRLHKLNGVKIGVPIAKMSNKDLGYVEKITNQSIDNSVTLANKLKSK